MTGGTTVLSDRIVVEISTRPGESFIDRMIALVEGADRQKTPNEIALNILLVGLTLIFILAVVTLQPFAVYSNAKQSIIVLVGLLVCLAPTTIGALLSAIGIAGMDRLVQRNVLAMSGRAVEAAGDVSTLLLDKTGTITYGNRQAAGFLPVGGRDEHELAEVVLLSSLADETPEGRSIVDLCEVRYDLTAVDMPGAELVPFTAQTRMCGHRVGGPLDPQGRRGFGAALGGGARGPGSPRPGAHRGAHRAGRAVRRSSSPRAQNPSSSAECHPPQGHGEDRHCGALRRDSRASGSAP